MSPTHFTHYIMSGYSKGCAMAVDLNEILRDWRVRANQFGPKCWAGHYYSTHEGYKIRGELSFPTTEYDAVYFGIAPWSISYEVDMVAVVLDLDTELWVVSMSHEGKGTRTTFWIVHPDPDEWAFVAEKREWSLGPIPEGLGVLAQHKLKEGTDDYPYEAAVLAVNNAYHGI